MKLYVVIFHDDSLDYGELGDHILGIFDNTKEAEKYSNKVEMMRSVRRNRDSYVTIQVYEMNKRYTDNIDYLG